MRGWIGTTFLSAVFYLGSAFASCPQAEKVAASSGVSSAVYLYESCALKFNDDASQILLARLYRSGKEGLLENAQKALLFYHLSAENGNAAAQTEFAEWLLMLDETEEGRALLQTYLAKVQTRLASQEEGRFKGELLHPYTLLLLASEKESSKWYYPSKQRQEPRAAVLLRRYNISPEKKEQALRDATLWKNKKLRQTASIVLSKEDYREFVEKIFPARGKTDPFQRQQAVDMLRDAVTRFEQADSI